MKTNTSIALLALGFAASAHAAIVDLGAFAGHEYFYDTGSFFTLASARLGAQAAGDNLVSITSSAENNFLISTITPITGSSLFAAWIGLSRAANTDPFVWDSGEPFVYNNWRPAGVGETFAEPTNGAFGGNETAVVFYVNGSGPQGSIPVGYWADTFGSSGQPFNAIYETPEPTTLSLVGIGVIGWLTVKRRNRNA